MVYLCAPLRPANSRGSTHPSRRTRELEPGRSPWWRRGDGNARTCPTCPSRARSRSTRCSAPCTRLRTWRRRGGRADLWALRRLPTPRTSWPRRCSADTSSSPPTFPTAGSLSISTRCGTRGGWRAPSSPSQSRLCTRADIATRPRNVRMQPSSPGGRCRPRPPSPRW